MALFPRNLQNCISWPIHILILLHLFDRDKRFWDISDVTQERPRLLTSTGQRRPTNMKGRSLGERPAFLSSPPGCGLSKPWGVWEGGFDERPGGPPAGLGKLVWCGASQTSAARSRCKS